MKKREATISAIRYRPDLTGAALLRCVVGIEERLEFWRQILTRGQQIADLGVAVPYSPIKFTKLVSESSAPDLKHDISESRRSHAINASVTTC